jgi:hypothetical protein
MNEDNIIILQNQFDAVYILTIHCTSILYLHPPNSLLPCTSLKSNLTIQIYIFLLLCRLQTINILVTEFSEQKFSQNSLCKKTFRYNAAAAI